MNAAQIKTIFQIMMQFNLNLSANLGSIVSLALEANLNMIVNADAVVSLHGADQIGRKAVASEMNIG